MLRILLPNNNKSERSYATELLLAEFLGLSLYIKYGKQPNPIVELKNGNRLILEDHFFHKYPTKKEYLSQNSFPTNVSFQKKDNNPFIPENDIPIIFGTDLLKVSGNKIICGIDIIASSFFMLTRWEEYILPERDLHGRFPAEASLAYKHGFLHRPIVNEYVEMLWNMLVHLGIQQKRKPLHFNAIVTHDVDIPRLLPSFYSFIKKTGGDILKRKSLKELNFTLKSFYRIFCLKKKDPWDTFDYLMGISEKHNLRSHFFFMAGGQHPLDNYYSIHAPYIIKLLSEIINRGHIIGFHPSYNAHLDNNIFRSEIDTLRKVTKQPVNCGRQHFLRFDVPRTWQIWEDNAMDWDGTLCYAGQAGFRCGICLPFPVFNFLERKKLKLKEIPLTVMEGTYAIIHKTKPEIMFNEISGLIDTVKKYQGTFVFLWHNSSFNSPGYQPYQWMYENIIQELAGN